MYLIRRHSGRNWMGGGHAKLPHEPGSTPNRSKRQTLYVLIALVMLVAVISRPPTLGRRYLDENIQAGKVAQDTIKSDVYFKTVDQQRTKENAEEAADRVPDIYRVDRERVQNQLNLLQTRIEAVLAKRDELGRSIRTALTESDALDREEHVVAQAVAEYAKQLADQPDFQMTIAPEALAVWLTPDPATLPKRVLPPPPGPGQSPGPVVLEEPADPAISFLRAATLTRLAKNGLEYVLSHGVLKPGLAGDISKKTAVIVREDPMADQKTSEEMPLAKVPTPDDARDILGARIADLSKLEVAQEQDRPADWAKLHLAALAMARPAVAETLVFDQLNTNVARENARKSVETIYKEIQPGEILQRVGERWSNQSVSDVKSYWSMVRRGREPIAQVFVQITGSLLFAVLALGFLNRAMLLFCGRTGDVIRNENLALLLICATLLLGRLVSYFEPTGFLAPVTACAILLSILVGARQAVAPGLIAAALVSVQYAFDWRLMMVQSAMALAAILSVTKVRRRSDMTLAALKATVIGAAVALTVGMATDALFSEASLQRLFLIALNGCACILLAPAVLPPLERLFEITTDIQLLEYSDLNNEVLGRLAIEVPATYSHSLALGQLAEAAADAIGANGLLARVSAYYHDIGKLAMPEYFSENQTGSNIHNELSPRTSARAIAAHTLRGVEMAHEYHLPEPLISAIREHHGTLKISFFYEQAQRLKRHDELREEDFRYAGPKPQSQETAILMICDAVESGLRSMRNPNEERIREFVDKIIQQRADDGQFDECDLTLRQLDIVEAAVARRMLSMMHTRVAYPDKVYEKKMQPISGENSIDGGSSITEGNGAPNAPALPDRAESLDEKTPLSER